MKFKSSKIFAIIAFSAFTVAGSQAAIILTGSTVYTQNFDTLITTSSATFSDNSTITGLYAQRTGTGTDIVANNGSSTTGALYSYGTGTETDRALGSLGSGNAAAGSFAWGFVFQNNALQTLNLSALGFTGEQWRNSAAAAQTVTFSYTVAAAAVTNLTPGADTGWTNLSAFDFTSPITGGTAGALDGNAAANRTVISGTPNINIPAGQFITLRWRDIDHSGSDHGLAIDDVSVTFIPEPTTALLGGLGLLALLRRRR